MNLSFLLDSPEPGVRYLAMRSLTTPSGEHPDLAAAREAAYAQGPIADVLSAMHPEGFWDRQGPGYNPKYTSTVWAIILLAQLGASVHHDSRIATACRYLLDNNLNPAGQFSTSNAPSGTVDCLQGNLCWALATLECQDPRLETAFEWMARSVTGEGIAPSIQRDAPVRYYAYKCGPLFACGANNRLPCAWGAVKVMRAFGCLSPKQRKRTPLIQKAINNGLDFLLDHNPAQAAYPHAPGAKPSNSWWKFGFPVFYVTDILQIAEAAAALGAASDPRLAETIQLIRSKQDNQGRWTLEYDYTGKTHGHYGAKHQPNPWVTLRALRVLRAAENQN